jgi:hypothetical protein
MLLILYKWFFFAILSFFDALGHSIFKLSESFSVGTMFQNYISESLAANRRQAEF